MRCARYINAWRGAREITIRAVGHADSQPISGRNRAVFADNYALSEARARTVAEYLAISLNVPASRVHVVGRGADEPLNEGKDAASLAANRRVDIVIEGARFEANAPLELTRAGGETQRIETSGIVLRGPGSGVARNLRKTHAQPQRRRRRSTSPPEPRNPLAHAAKPMQRRRSPRSRSQSSTSPVSAPNSPINGRPVNALNFDGITLNQASTVALSRWRGVDLSDGDNKLAARIFDADGKVVWQQSASFTTAAARCAPRSIPRLRSWWPMAARGRSSRCACSTSTARRRAPAPSPPSASILRIARGGRSNSSTTTRSSPPARRSRRSKCAKAVSR